VVHPLNALRLFLTWRVRAGSGFAKGIPITIRVRGLGSGEAEKLAQMMRSRTLGAGLVRRAQIVRHAGLSGDWGNADGSDMTCLVEAGRGIVDGVGVAVGRNAGG
jgi:hypothetical protein